MDVDQVLRLIGVSAGIVVVIVIVFELFLRLICRVVRRSGGTESSIRTITEVIRIVYVLIAAIAVASYTGIANSLTVLTLSGVAGLLVSLALQPTLSNMISGYYLMREGLIRVGDVVVYNAMKGRVIRVALRNTWILTEMGEVVVVGNTSLFNGPLINVTRSPSFVQQYQR
ncbi:MscS Mechanosensitive ion channel [mine drainage metagenome]|uniref:MscS Mechanosensitive ion channel n=1 Tax=mine drainage metagenome TaxID=410659 RepID=T1C7H5_9ZZZZ